MKLNKTKNELDREARNNENENWERLEGVYNDIVDDITDEVSKRIEDTHGVPETILNSVYNNSIIPDWEHGFIGDGSGKDSSLNEDTRIRTKGYVRVNSRTRLKFESGILVRLHRYSLDNFEWQGFVEISDEEYFIYEDCYIRLMMRYVNEQSFDSLESLSSKCSIHYERIDYGEINLEKLSEEVSSSIFTNEITPDFEHGALNSEGKNNNNLYDRTIRTGYIRAYEGMVIGLKDNELNPTFRVYYYDLDKTFESYVGFRSSDVVIEKSCYIRIVMRYSVESDFDSLESLSKKIRLTFSKNNETSEVSGSLDAVFDGKISATWEHGHIGIGEGTDSSFNQDTRIRCDYIRAYAGMFFNIYRGVRAYIHFYSLDDKSYIGNSEDWVTINYTIRQDCYIRIVLSYTNEDNFDSLESLSSKIRFTVNNNLYGIPDYMREDIEDVSRRLSKRTGTFNVGFITDIHSYNQHILGAAKMTQYGQMEFLVNGGDLVIGLEKNFDDTADRMFEASTAFANAKKPVYSVRGNHDVDDRGDDGRTFLNEHWFNTMVKPFLNDVMVRNPNDPRTGYYFVDNDEYKVRTIFVNTTSTNYSGNGYITDEQLQWIANHALDLTDKENQNKWNVLVFGHHPIIQYFSNEVVTTSSLTLADVLKAFKNKSKYSNATHGINVDYSSNQADLIGYIFGHMHRDNMIIHEDYGYLMVSTLQSYCRVYSQSNTDATEKTGTQAEIREIGTNTEYAWDVFSFDLENKKLKVFRVGAGEDREIDY